MKTCLSDDHLIWSVLVGVFWIAIGTWHLSLWHSGVFAEFGWTWLYPLLALGQYGVAVLYLRYGVSYRAEWALKLLEPER